MTRPLVALFAAAIGAAALPAPAAQLGLEARAGYEDFTNAPRSTDAVFEHRGTPTFGLGVRADLGARWFARLSGSYLKQSGERVFVADADSPVFRLGHPLTLKLIPVFLDAAFRFRTSSRLHPYVGVGVGGVSYQETSTVANVDSSTDRTKACARALAGANWGRGRVQVGVEASYALMPKTLGADTFSSVSRVYGETDIGGLAGVATLTFRP